MVVQGFVETQVATFAVPAAMPWSTAAAARWSAVGGFFNTFPINMVLQYRKVGRWADYRYGELWYVFLSLGSKSLLAWVVFGGTQQPN